MRGNPFMRVAVALVVFLLLGIPVWRLTRAIPALPEVPVVSDSKGKDLRATTLNLSVEYEKAPTQVDFKLLIGDHNYAQESTLIANGQEAHSKTWIVSFPSSDLETELLVTTSWPDNNRHALRVSVSGADLSPAEKTFWLSNGDETHSDTMTLHFSNK